MPYTPSQAFLRELDKKLWTAADRLRSSDTSDSASEPLPIIPAQIIKF